VSEEEVRQWLRDAGFRPYGDRWIVDERDLGHLDPAEVRSLEDAPDDVSEDPEDDTEDLAKDE
jgi:hypothetical protein